MVILTLTIIALSIAAQVLGQNSDNEHITSQRVTKIKTLMNPNANPCHNFYEFACGNFNREHPIPQYKGKFGFLDVITEENFKIVNQSLSGEKSASSSSANSKAKILYKSCLDTPTIEKRGVQPLMDFLKKFGGWPVIDPNWSESSFDWLQTVIDMQVTFNDNFLFDVLVQPNYITGSGIQGLLLMGPGVLNHRNFVLYQDKVRNALVKFGVKSDQANKTAADIIDFEKGLRKLATPGSTSQNVSSIMATHPTFDWKRWLHGAYGADFDPADLITITYKGCVTGLSDYITKKGLKTTANYLLWRAVEQLMEVMGDDYMTVINDYNVKLEGLPTPVPRWRHCVEIVSQVMNYATASIVAAKTNPTHVTNNLNDMLNKVKTAMEESVLSSDWLEVDNVLKVLQKLSATEITLDYQSLIYNQSLLDEEYKDVDVENNNFFESYLALKSLDAKRYARVVKTKSRELTPLHNLIVAEARYALMRNDMTLMPGLLTPPLYSPAYPHILDFGTLGFLIAHEISHGFDNIGFMFNAKGGFQLMYQWEKLNNRSTCFRHQYESHTINGIPLGSSALILAEAMGDSTGLQLSYNAFERWLHNNNKQEDDPIAQILGFTNKKLFFVTAAQTLCGAIRPEATERFVETDGHSIGDVRVNEMIVNNENFGDVFKCPKDSPMNPVNKCSLF